jgi:hypothetical protein
LKVHQDSPNLLEQETKRETQKRDLSLWNFLKEKYDRTLDPKPWHHRYSCYATGGTWGFTCLVYISVTDVINQFQISTNHYARIPV